MSGKRKQRVVRSFTKNRTKVTINAALHNDLILSRDVCEWSQITLAINMLLSYALPAMEKDNVLSDDNKSSNLQSLMFLNNEINENVLYSLTYDIK